MGENENYLKVAKMFQKRQMKKEDEKEIRGFNRPKPYSRPKVCSNYFGIGKGFFIFFFTKSLQGISLRQLLVWLHRLPPLVPLGLKPRTGVDIRTVKIKVDLDSNKTGGSLTGAGSDATIVGTSGIMPMSAPN